MFFGFAFMLFGAVGFVVEIENYHEELVWDGFGLTMASLFALVGGILFYSGRKAHSAKVRPKMKTSDLAQHMGANNPHTSEENIQETIRKEVLKRDRQREEATQRKEEETINLNVLEDLTELPREEIEKIAQDVRQSFKKSNPLQVMEAAHACLQGVSGIYLAPNIPQRKLKMASHKLLPEAKSGDPLLGLIDFSVLGIGVDGIAIFEKYMVYAPAFGKAYRYHYTHLKNPREKEDWSVEAGGENFRLYSGKKAAAFARFLSQVVRK